MELEDLRRSLASEQEEKEQSYTDKMNQLTAQLQQLDAVVAQVLDPNMQLRLKGTFSLYQMCYFCRKISD